MVYSKKRRITSLTQPSLERLLNKVPSKYELVLLASRRARQIKRELDMRPEKTKDFEFNKPLTTALFEIVEGKITSEDLKYVDLFEEPEEGKEAPRIPPEVATKRFFEEDVLDLGASEDELTLEDIEEPEDLADFSEE